MNDKPLESEHCLQLAGSERIIAALERDAPVSLVLIAAGSVNEQRLIALAAVKDVPVRQESERDLWRMSRSTDAADALALLRRRPLATLADAMGGDGPAWLLSGVTYPSNVGSAIRVIEVTGGTVVCVDGPFNRKARLRSTRVSMRADRFIGVHWVDSDVAVAAARAAGRTIIGIEDTGRVAPWEVALDRPVLFVVGGERDGISPEVQEQCDVLIRLPMPGFIPSYSVQSAVSIVAAESLRQHAMNVV
ncbi:MAG: 23S rRNA (guanosine2251-2'-O)-methyltransferase [Myxococcota bacterium]